MTGWPVPYGAEGDPRLVRVFTSAVREGEQECPMHRALKAHPRIETTVAPAFKSQDFEDFPLEPVMRALDLIEDGKAGVARPLRPCHGRLPRPGGDAGRSGCTRGWPSGPRRPSRTTWKRRCRPLQMPGVGQPALVPVRDEWVQQLDLGRLDEPACGCTSCAPGAAGTRARTACSGSCACPGSGQSRARSASRARSPWRPASWRSVPAARVAEERGTGALRLATRRGRPYLVQQGTLPSWVRVVEVGCGDGSARVLFEGDPDKAQREYDEEARGRLRATVDSAERRPGRSCASCRLAPHAWTCARSPGSSG